MEVTCTDVKKRLDGGDEFLLLDCRERDEHALVRLERATLLPMSEIAERVAELAGRENDGIVVYCHHGGRSLRVAMWLRQQGYANAVSMAGGIDQWSVEIDPTLPRY